MDDVLSKILDDIHLNKSDYRYLHTANIWAFQLQQHTAIMIYIVLEGEMYLHLQHHPQPIHLKQGDIILLPSGQAHHCSYSKHDELMSQLDLTQHFDHQHEDMLFSTMLRPPYHSNHSNHSPYQTSPIPSLNTENTFTNQFVLIRCQIDSLTAKPLLNALPDYLHLHSNNHMLPDWLQIGLNFLSLEVQQHQPGRDKIIDHLLSILFIQCLRDYMARNQDTQNWLTALSHPQLSSALSAIHSHPEQNWTVESLAMTCCMSRSKFASLFNECIHTTPLAYLQQHRLKLACQYLRDSQLSIKQIASRIGYSDPALNQSLKKHLNMSPSQYRANFQKDIIE